MCLLACLFPFSRETDAGVLRIEGKMLHPLSELISFRDDQREAN
jgi:hypothetical protein